MKAFTHSTYTQAQALAWTQQLDEADVHVKDYNDQGHYPHYPDLFGIDSRVAFLSKAIADQLPAAQRKGWMLRFLGTVPTGCDTAIVYDRFMHWLLADPAHGMVRVKNHPLIHQTAQLFQDRLQGQPVELAQWEAAQEKTVRFVESNAAFKTAWGAVRVEAETHPPFAAIAFATAVGAMMGHAAQTAWADWAAGAVADAGLDWLAKAHTAALAAGSTAVTACHAHHSRMAEQLLALLAAAPAAPSAA